jgi:single-strand DNA-binding protein
VASYNRITLVGNLTRDPERRAFDSGNAVVSFSLAVNRRVGKDKPPETDYIDVTAWGTLGDRVLEYLKKGASALVEGRLQIRPYEDKDGNKRKAVEVVADDVRFLDRKPEGSNGHVVAAGKFDAEAALDEDVPF